MAVWSQKIYIFSGISDPFMKEHCHLLFEVLKQSHEFANLHEIKHASAELATCTAAERGTRQSGPRALLHALHHYALHTKYFMEN